MVRPIVRQGGAEVEADETKIIPRFATCVVYDDKSATWSNRMRDKVVGLTEDTMVGGNSGQVVIRTHEVESEFCLWKKLGPVINREGGVGAREYTEEVAFECLDGAFGVVGAVVFGRDEVVGDELRREEVQ